MLQANNENTVHRPRYKRHDIEQDGEGAQASVPGETEEASTFWSRCQAPWPREGYGPRHTQTGRPEEAMDT
jgi:hypothetical protein